ncbi:MAG: hypothetical protein AB7G88_00360 [Thermomicrobiales bacterium]
MTIETAINRQRLQNFQFRELFVSGLGWDNPSSGPMHVSESDNAFTFERVAEKAGVQVVAGGWDSRGEVPNYQIRRQIQREIAKLSHEHLIVFTDRDQTQQVWHWIKREPGQPSRARERQFFKGQSGEPILQALQSVRFTLDEETELTINAVTNKLEKAFDKDKVTKKFYDKFKDEHDAFQTFVSGIPMRRTRSGMHR